MRCLTPRCLPARAGAVPELLNGRLCMIAVPAAIASELVRHNSIGAQFGEAAPIVLLFAALFSAASIIPALEGSSAAKTGFWNSGAEQMNGARREERAPPLLYRAARAAAPSRARARRPAPLGVHPAGPCRVCRC